MNKEDYDREETYAHFANRQERLSQHWLKSKRADDGIELIREHSTCLPNHLYEIGFQQPALGSFPEGGETGFDFTYWPKKQIPEYFAVLIGEVLHNLRSALDYAYVGMIRSKVEELENGEKTRIQFPFSEAGKDALINQFNHPQYRPVHREMPELQEFMVNEIQPYTGGNDTLLSLHILNILDKHNLIIPAVAVMNVPISAIVHSPRRLEITLSVGGGDANGPSVFLPEGPYTLTSDINVGVKLSFGQVHMYGYKPVLQALVNISSSVRETLFKLDRFTASI